MGENSDVFNSRDDEKEVLKMQKRKKIANPNNLVPKYLSHSN